MPNLKLLLCCAATACCFTNADAQGILKKMKDKAAAISDKVIDKKVDDAINNSNGNSSGNNAGMPGGSTTNSRNNPTNKGGQGLITTPPDVKENLTSAEAAFKNANYGEARYEVQQAMLGVEMQIGQDILKSLPETVAGLKKDASADQVTSTGWGWVGLTIQRQYQEGDKQLRVTIANNAAWMQAINLYLTNGGYAQTTGGQQNWKQTKVKGYRAVIEYDESSGYKLSIPIGQTSLLILEGVNFANEQDIMNAANQFDIDGIKTRLGEK